MAAPDLSLLSDNQLLAMAGHPALALGDNQAQQITSDFTNLSNEELLKLAGMGPVGQQQPESLINSALQGVADYPKATWETLKAIPHGIANLYEVATNPISSVQDGTAEKVARATGGAASFTAGAGLGASIGAPLAPFTLGLSIPLLAALGGATGYLGYNKLNQLTGSDATTTAEQDLHDLAYNTGQAATGNVIMRALSSANKKIAQKTENWGQELDRKSIGTQYGDYKKTLNDLQSIETPEGGLESLTKHSVDDFLKNEKLPISRKPEEVVKRVVDRQQNLGRQIEQIIKGYDDANGPPVKVKFDRAIDFLVRGKVPADQVDRYFSKVINLEEGINREGGGRLGYLQQQKIALGKSWDTADGVLNDFNRALYSDLQKSIESAVPSVKPLNVELQKTKIVEPIAKRALAVAEGSDPISRLINIGKTTGGYGLPIALATNALGPVAGPVLGYAIGSQLNRMNGKAALGAAFKAGSKVSDLAQRASPSSDFLSGAVSTYHNRGIDESNNQGIGSQKSKKINLQDAQDLETRNIPTYPNPTPTPEAKQVETVSRKDISYLVEQQHPLVRAMVKQESGGNPSAVSPKGAKGLMQLMPATARDLGVNPDDPMQNLQGGIQYINAMLEKFGDIRLALAAYNYGPGAVEKKITLLARRGQRPTWQNLKPMLPAETKNYVTNVYSNYLRFA